METAIHGSELAGVGPFAGHSEADLDSIAGLMIKVHVRPGLHLLRKGEPGFEFFVVLEGAAEVTTDGITVATLQRGDVFGEMALLGGRKRNADVTATSAMTLGMMMVWNFRSLLDDFPTVKANLTRLASERT